MAMFEEVKNLNNLRVSEAKQYFLRVLTMEDKHCFCFKHSILGGSVTLVCSNCTETMCRMSDTACEGAS